MSDSDPIKLFSYLIEQVNKRAIAYIHAIEPRASLAGGSDEVVSEAPSTLRLFKKLFTNSWISAFGYKPESAKKVIESGEADAIAFG